LRKSRWGMLRTKIIVTIGPASSDYDIVKSFLREGVSGFRINFSHGDPKTWDKYLDIIKEASRELNVYPAIIGDLRGPQLRIGDFNAFKVSKGDIVTLKYSPENKYFGEEKIIPINYSRLFEFLEVGDIILLEDGRVRLRVEEAYVDHAKLIALDDAIIHPRKTLIVSRKEIELPTLTSSDIEAVKYAISREFTYLALSYVHTPRDIVMLRDLLSRLGRDDIGIIAKIETRNAIKNLKSIVSEADAVIVARGDLGMYYSLEEIPRLQKIIINESIKLGKPVLIATQLLESMVNNPQPTRSEVVDIMNAVFDSVDAVLLTNETAIGKYPVESVKWLKKILREAEKWFFEEGREPVTRRIEPLNPREKYAKGLVLLAESIGSKILVYTKTGLMPSRISKYRPSVQVYAGSSNEIIIRKLSLNYGVKPCYIESDKTLNYEEGIDILYKKLFTEHEISYGDIVLLTYGPREALLNVIKIVEVI